MTYPIPAKALAQHIAILGKTGSGKTTAAKAAVETIIDAAGRVCVIDPTGAWWGMKSSATGKSAGYPFVIFGGSHADFPLGATHGEAIAEIVGTSSTLAIIDTSQLRVGERTRLFTDFADALMRKNRGPLHLYIDEAHMFMPQGKVPDPQSGQMLAAGNNIVSGGRSRGLRITLITQRPAKLHKDSLTQVETLVAMRLIAPQDRHAVEEWIADNADEKRGREIITSLATLKTGEAWVWAPECGVLDRVKFPRIRTFDSSAAPAGTDEAGVVLAPVDGDTIRSKLSKIAAEVVANDPKVLKARIAELERAAKAAPAAGPLSDTERMKAQEYGQRLGYEIGAAAAAESFEKRLAIVADTVTDAMHELKRVADSVGAVRHYAEVARTAQPKPAAAVQNPRRMPHPTPPRAAPATRGSVGPNGGSSSGDVPPSVRKILDAIHKSYPVSMSFEAAARRAGISNRSSAYGRYQTAVEESHEVERIEGRLKSRPEYGVGGDVDGAASVAEWVRRLPPSYGKMLEAVQKYGPVGRDEIADAAGVSRTSSGLGAGLRELTSLKLVREVGGRYELEEGLR